MRATYVFQKYQRRSVYPLITSILSCQFAKIKCHIYVVCNNTIYNRYYQCQPKHIYHQYINKLFSLLANSKQMIYFRTIYSIEKTSSPTKFNILRHEVCVSIWKRFHFYDITFLFLRGNVSVSTTRRFRFYDITFLILYRNVFLI